MKKIILLFICLAVLTSVAYGQQKTAEESSPLFPVKQNDKWGYIDKTGKTIIKPQFNGCCGFSEGLARVKIKKKWSFIDKTGKIVIESKSDGCNCTENMANDLHIFGVISVNDVKIVTAPEFYGTSRRGFPEGLAVVKIGGKFGYIDKTGKTIINPQFRWAWEFSGGLALVRIGDEYGYIDKTGMYIWEPTK